MVKARQQWHLAIYGGRKGLQVQCNAVTTGYVVLISTHAVRTASRMVLGSWRNTEREQHKGD